ncbi:MAG: transposase, partial [Holosporales bacterium]|nr:transposase [Holosporales bacterium]
VTGIRKDMKNILMNMQEKVLLRKRSIIETVFGYLKRTKELEHTRHRSVTNMIVHVVSTLVSYQLMDRKPSISSVFETLP